MKKNKSWRLGSKGFAHHFLMPVIAVIAVGIIGAAYLALSRAATVSLYTGNCAQKVQLLQSSAASANATCVQQVQDLINIYQYAATNPFAISGKGEVFSYSGRTMVLMNGSYNGATQSAVNTLSKSPSLTNGNTGSWQTFCSTVAGKKSTAAFTGHTTYDFSPGKNKASGYYIGTSGTTIFNSVCGSPVSSSTGGGTTTTGSTGTHVCSSYTFGDGTTSMGSSLTKPAPGDCVRLIQTILNGTYQSNYKSYDSVADSFSSQTQTAKGILTVDGNFGPATRSQLQAFQAVYNNLPVNGSVGTAANWNALCGEALSFKTDTATWKKAAYQDATNVFSGQSRAWSGCTTSMKQPTYSQHATAPTVGVPAPVISTGGGGSTSGGGTPPKGTSVTASCSIAVSGQFATSATCTVSNGATIHYSFPSAVDMTVVSNANANGCKSLYSDTSGFNTYIYSLGLSTSSPAEYNAVQNALPSAAESRFPHCF